MPSISVADITAIIVGFATIYYLWRANQLSKEQNQIFREQNEIIAKQEGKAMGAPSPVTGLQRYWPMLGMGVMTLLVFATLGYDYYDRHFVQKPLLGFQWQPWLALLIGTLLIVGCSIYVSRVQHAVAGTHRSEAGLWPDLELCLTQTSDRLLVFLRNNTNATIKGCQLVVVQVLPLSKNRFVPTSFHSLLLIRSQDIAAGDLSSKGVLARSGNVEHTNLNMEHIDGGVPPWLAREPGTWMAKINVQGNGKWSSHEVFFKWEKGKSAQFLCDTGDWFRDAPPSSNEEDVAALREEIRRLKALSKPWFATYDQDKGYEIESAWYGAPNHEAIDVSAKVKELAASGKPIAANPLILVGKDVWEGVLKSLKVTFSIVKSDGKEVFTPSFPAAFSDASNAWIYLTNTRELAEISDSPNVTYKNKIRVVLKNDSGKEIQVWTPLWDERSEVQCQWPLGSSLQAAGPKGYLSNDWLGEQNCLRLKPQEMFRCWIGLMPPVGESIEIRANHQRNGTLIFPLKAENKLYEAHVKI